MLLDIGRELLPSGRRHLAVRPPQSLSEVRIAGRIVGAALDDLRDEFSGDTDLLGDLRVRQVTLSMEPADRVVALSSEMRGESHVLDGLSVRVAGHRGKSVHCAAYFR